MNPRLVWLIPVVGLLALSGCGGVESNSQVKGKPIAPEVQAQADLMVEVGNLKSRVQSLSGEVDDLTSQVRALTEGQGAGSGASLPELNKRLGKVEANIRQMASQLGVEVDGQQPAAQPGQDQGAPAAQQPQGQVPPPAQPQVQVPPAPAPQAQVSPAPQPGSAPAASPQMDPAQTLYTNGMQAFQTREYDKAIGIWNDLAKSYPKHALAPNAFFWMGEAYYAKNDMPQAVLNYQEVIEKFPKNNKAPAAMLKQGMAFGKLGKKEAAKLVFQDLIKKFPDSAEAKRAKTLL
jgi:tol-pal system protein YbgF